VGDVKRVRVSADPVGYLSIREAADLLGMTGRFADKKLRRVLLGKEAAAGERIMIRMGSRRPWFAVTMPLLRKWCPELFSARDEIVAMVREEMSDLREQVEELAERDAVLAGEIGACVKRVDRLENGEVPKKMRPHRDTQGHAPVNG